MEDSVEASRKRGNGSAGKLGFGVVERTEVSVPDQRAVVLLIFKRIISEAGGTLAVPSRKRVHVYAAVLPGTMPEHMLPPVVAPHATRWPWWLSLMQAPPAWMRQAATCLLWAQRHMQARASALRSAQASMLFTSRAPVATRVFPSCSSMCTPASAHVRLVAASSTAWLGAI